MHYLCGLCVHVSVLCLHPFPSRECINMGTSASLLAQTFSLLVRQTADCLERCWDLLHSPTPPCVLPVREEDPGELYGWVWGELEGVWMWLVSAMDELESQLCLGNAVSRKIPKGTVIIRTNCSLLYYVCSISLHNDTACRMARLSAAVCVLQIDLAQSRLLRAWRDGNPCFHMS